MFKNALIAGVLLATFAPTMVGATNNGYDSEKNKPSYWGANCDKTEFNGQINVFTPGRDNVSKIIVKGGTTNKVYDTPPFIDLTSEINEKNGKPYGISHVIECFDEVEVLATEEEDSIDNQPEVTQNESKPEVKAAVDQPTTLPKTGASPILSFMVGTFVSLAAWQLFEKRDELEPQDA